MIAWLSELWCDYFHGGGRINRDEQGRINWQCDRCGRWGEPVEQHVEERIIERDIRERMRS
jgi:hypothetical protein